MDKEELLRILNDILKKLNLLNSDILVLSKDKTRLKSIAKKIYKLTKNDSLLQWMSSKKFKPIKKIKSITPEDVQIFLTLMSQELKQCSSISSKQQAELTAELEFFAGTKSLINETLPIEVLVNIFSFLDVGDKLVASLVCQHWNETAKDDALWRDILLEEKPAFDKAFVNDLRLPDQSIFALTADLLTQSSNECFLIFKEGDIDDPVGSVNLNIEDFLTAPHYPSLDELHNAAAFMSQGAQLFIIKLDVSDNQLDDWQAKKDLGQILQHVKSLDFNDVVYRNDGFQKIAANKTNHY